MAERLQKVLARWGLGSRREIEGWIREGRLKVNGRVAELGQALAEGDRVQLDGKPLRAPRLFTGRRRVILYHKPVGEVCTAWTSTPPACCCSPPTANWPTGSCIPPPRSSASMPCGRMDK